MDHDIYISSTYADRETAASLASFLESRDMTVWRGPDPAGEGASPTGDREQVAEAIRDAKVMVLVFTDSVQDSPEIMSDVRTAVQNGVTIIPFRLTDRMPAGSLGFYLKPLQWLDAYGQDEAAAREALAELCLSNVRPPEVTEENEGPETALLRKKNKRRSRILIICGCVVAALAIAAAALLPKNNGPSSRDLSCEEFLLQTYNNMSQKYGSGTYDAIQATDKNGKYSIWEYPEGSTESKLAVVIRFFDENDEPPASNDDGFKRIGMTNMTDNEVVTSREQWTPYMKSLLATLFPEYSDDRLDGMIEDLYATKDGASKLITGNYTITFQEIETVYLVEVFVK